MEHEIPVHRKLAMRFQSNLLSLSLSLSLQYGFQIWLIHMQFIIFYILDLFIYFDKKVHLSWSYGFDELTQFRPCVL